MIGFVRIIQRSDDRDVFLAFEKLFVFFFEKKKNEEKVFLLFEIVHLKTVLGRTIDLNFFDMCTVITPTSNWIARITARIWFTLRSTSSCNSNTWYLYID